MQHEEESTLYGLMAEFDNPDALLDAAKKTFAEGYRKIDGYSPLPIHGLGDAIGTDHWSYQQTAHRCHVDDDPAMLGHPLMPFGRMRFLETEGSHLSR